MPLTLETFAALVLEDTDGRWEIYDSKLREKPQMSFGHNQAARELARQLIQQLHPRDFEVLQNAGHLVIPGGDSFIPDVAVVPTSLTDAMRAQPTRFEAYTDPLPLVVEIWSPSTGSYDIDKKIPGYQTRGDLEIWRIHPFERTLTMWRRQEEERYVETTADRGLISLHALPDVTIDLDSLFGEN